MIKQVITAVALTGALLCATAPAHAAAAIRECGAYGWDENGSGPRFMGDGEIVGAGVYNITTRVATCRRARKIVRRYWHDYTDWCGNSSRCSIGWGFTCRRTRLGIELADVRCTASRGRVVRWQDGA